MDDEPYENKKNEKTKKKKEDSEELMEKSLVVLDVEPSNIELLR